MDIFLPSFFSKWKYRACLEQANSFCQVLVLDGQILSENTCLFEPAHNVTLEKPFWIKMKVIFKLHMYSKKTYL